MPVCAGRNKVRVHGLSSQTQDSCLFMCDLKSLTVSRIQTRPL